MRRLLLVFFLAWLTVPAAASGQSATASIPDRLGDNGASFTQEPTDVTHLHIVWDGSVLTVRLTYARPPASYRLALLLSDTNDQTSDAQTCDDSAADRIQITADGAGQATLEMPFIEGQLRSAGVPADITITYSFSHPEMTTYIARGNDPFTCVQGNADGDDLYGAFAGKTLKLTPQGAQAALAAALGRRFGAAFTRASRRWVKCPKEEIIPATETFSAFIICELEFGRGGRYRSGWTRALILGGRYDVTSHLHVGKPYRKTLRSCPIARNKRSLNGAELVGRRLRYGGGLGSRRTCWQLVGSAGMATDLEYPAVRGRLPRRVRAYEHGTNRAGFQDRAVFPCRTRRAGRRYTFDCRNRLGDRFIYSFTVRRS